MLAELKKKNQACSWLATYQTRDKNMGDNEEQISQKYVYVSWGHLKVEP